MTNGNGATDRRRLSSKEKIFIGGVGALVPMFATFPVEDYLEFFYYPDRIQLVSGFLIRAVALFAVGSFWVYLHKSEHDPMKIFQLGIVAPAMILGVVNANNFTSDTSGQPDSESQRSLTGWSIVTTALAQPASTTSRNPRISADNIARYVGKGRWDWTVYIKAPSKLKKKVKCVKYTLHKTFRNRIRKVCKTKDKRYPFGLSTNGWGTFLIKIDVELTDGKHVALTHQLKFKESQLDSLLRGIFGSTKRK
ncbi:MAG: hypothetical protein IH904_06675 [Proteobacteria bacterium]|nr:hypothetical protein [Pseudomonadota bacterium]